jgi:3-deoxy-manno-octulosonate cytidylyltransferase (CMP-KDO synthetase)
MGMTENRQDVLAVIPSRLGAQRFPGKPLALIAGKPMIQWVWEAAKSARRVTRVVVATDHEKIFNAVRRFGGEAMMTSKTCPSGTDRVAEVARTSRAGIVVNVQGDEPLLSPQVIDRAVEALQQDTTAVMSTAVRKAENEREWRNPNVVKAVLDRMNYALYFSRSPIPWEAARAAAPRSPHWVHIGLYAFKRPFLFRFAALPPSPLEQSEKLEQLRVLEHGCAIKVVIAQGMSCAVDRPEDIRKVERVLAKSRTKEGKTT